MDTKQITHSEAGGRARRRILTLIVAIAAMGATLTVGVNPASAATQPYRQGSPGYYTVGKVSASVVYNADRGDYNVALTVDGPTMWRSPTVGGVQMVAVQTELWMYGSATGWRVWDTRIAYGTVGNGSVKMSSVTFNSTGTGSYFIRQQVAWTNGMATVDYNQPSDYLCTGYLPAGWAVNLCKAYSAGYIQLPYVSRTQVAYAY